VSPDTAVGGVATVDISFMHPDASVGETHPVSHRCSNEFTASGDLVLPGVSTGFYGLAGGVDDASVEVGALVLDFFSDAEASSGGFVFGAAGRNPVIHRDLITNHEEAALHREIDLYVRVRRVGLREEFFVFPGAGSAGIAAGFEVSVCPRRVGVDPFGFSHRSLSRVGLWGAT